MKGHSCVAIKKDGTKAGRFKSPKAKGRHLLRDIALSIRFIKDLVRHPDRNSVDTSLFRSCEQSPHFPHFSDICVARVSSLPSFQLPGMSSVAGSLQCLWSALFFWKIALPLKK
jgi:hypothetical protein